MPPSPVPFFMKFVGDTFVPDLLREKPPVSAETVSLEYPPARVCIMGNKIRILVVRFQPHF